VLLSMTLDHLSKDKRKESGANLGAVAVGGSDTVRWVDGRCKMPMLLRYYSILFAPSVCMMVGRLTKVVTNPAERAVL
jgi:hypothetical protein